MVRPLHPFEMTHFEFPWGFIMAACRPLAIVVTGDPQKVTCPRCREGLHRLQHFLDVLATETP
jgi:hypothetical protein